MDFTNFAESRSAEFENKWQLNEEPDILQKGTNEFEESFKSQVNDDIRITIEDENNEMQDNDAGNESEELFLSALSVASGSHFKQPAEFPSIDNNEHNLATVAVADTSAIPKHQEKKLDQPDDQYTSDLCLVLTEDPAESTRGVFDKNGSDDVDGEVSDLGNSLGSSDAHYEKLKKLDQNPPNAELFPPNMQDIFKELPNSADNILNFSRAEMERRSERDDDYTGGGYDDDISGYL